ncbi:Ribosomal protein S18 acetylase RimI and related acetyltransferases [Chelatococcus sambhunathii]|uniref:GNAT family N-acetyltransferase n=2 Tax=Chelatococcus TaxID=28209 RepID=A0AAC9JR10_9HYPH|nr:MULTISPECIES: GNAT family N-acetyltransferase [Chelatococcus]APF36851.1 GNAT family N-acetyltransferase [Chelatococcus daeguensis]CUA88305.1 Ribosomal protein S18 acetylase RimI and related acetyltransferases [Chelatococcus sambhunathii]
MRFRDATGADLAAIVALLADDPLGATREAPAVELPSAYAEAFAAIAADANNRLIVADDGGAVVGCLQLTFIPGLTYTGGWRAQIEGVRIAQSQRGRGLGRAMFNWAIEQARARGCRLVQLTTNKARPDALRFYESLGFTASHEGMKLDLEAA